MNGEVLPLRKANCMSGHGFTLGIVFGGRRMRNSPRPTCWTCNEIGGFPFRVRVHENLRFTSDLLPTDFQEQTILAITKEFLHVVFILE